jgi:hypothetical protein
VGVEPTGRYQGRCSLMRIFFFFGDTN